jgi:glycosyltransferase involved in cell wall biosynthesis
MQGGFAQARNHTLEYASGEWFLWIDADETLVGNGGLRKYLDSGPFNGFALKQNHLMLDAPSHFDTPVRVFRRRPDVQFYGCVHEQPQMGDCNGDILPALQLYDAQIAHTGYLHEAIRRNKSIGRNLPLLMRDMHVFPDRRLGKVLVIRDLITQAAWKVEANGGTTDDAVWTMYRQAISLFESHFMDPSDRFHDLARPFYEAAVCKVRGAIEVETSLGGAVQGLQGRRAEPKRFWVRTHEHIAPLLDWHRKQAMKVFETTPIDVEPWVPVREQEAVTA